MKSKRTRILRPSIKPVNRANTYSGRIRQMIRTVKSIKKIQSGEAWK